MQAALRDWTHYQLHHNKVGVSTTQAHLLKPDVNIVHVRRPHGRTPVRLQQRIQQQVAELGPSFIKQAVVRARRAEEDIADLLQPLDADDVREHVRQEIDALVDVFRVQLRYDAVRVKLEVLGTTRCPKFHADTVGMRALVTLSGPGTWYIANRHVKREWQWQPDGVFVAVAQVDEAHAVQADTGDTLFLRGNAWPGNFGMGAVHKSPAVEDEGDGVALRLLLTVDDTVPQGDGGACRDASCGCTAVAA